MGRSWYRFTRRTNPFRSKVAMASRAAVAEQWQFAAMVFIDGQHFSFCPALLTRKLYTVNWIGVRW
ncbi:MAG: hypothetical protein OSJ58_16635 [Dysosmobacter sp.]|nr:hypothetical protein [Dysosmobacter sp.]